MSPEAALKACQKAQTRPATDDDAILRRHVPRARYVGTFEDYTVVWLDDFGFEIVLLDRMGGIVAHTPNVKGKL